MRDYGMVRPFTNVVSVCCEVSDCPRKAYASVVAENGNINTCVPCVGVVSYNALTLTKNGILNNMTWVR